MGFNLGAWENPARLKDKAAAKGGLSSIVGEVKDDVVSEGERRARLHSIGVVQRLRDLWKNECAKLDCLPLGASFDGVGEGMLLGTGVGVLLSSTKGLVGAPCSLLCSQSAWR
jgi:hypothetical protein